MGAAGYLRSLRFQLTAAYLLVFGLVFTAVVVVGLGVARSSVRGELDRELQDRARQMVAALVQSEDPFTIESLGEAAQAESRTVYFRGFHVQVRSESGEPIARSESLEGRDLPLSDAGAAWMEGEPMLETSSVEWTTGEPAEPFRVATLHHASPGIEPFVVQVASDLGPVREPLSLMNRLAWTGLLVALLAAAAASWLAAGRAMSRLGQIADAVRAVGLDDLGERPIVPPTPDPEVRRLAADLNRLLARVADGLRARERFIQDVSHELKTPLSVLSSEAQVVQIRKDLSMDAREFAASVGEEARHLSRLVESMLALARAEATGDMAQAEEASAYDAVVAAVSGCQPIAREAGVSLELTLGGEAGHATGAGTDMDADAAAEDSVADDDALFFGDPELVTAMVSNLIRNAISYSPKTGGVVHVSAAHNAECIRVAVEDQGPGIPPEAIGRIFDRFAQARASDSARGHGLGLSIARTVAELHGGRLSVENLSPSGCRFTVTLSAVLPAENAGS
ncbi:MAG: HAMP domain-containing sensor histidine kinase [Planctomycetota bacterium]